MEDGKEDFFQLYGFFDFDHQSSITIESHLKIFHFNVHSSFFFIIFLYHSRSKHGVKRGNNWEAINEKLEANNWREKTLRMLTASQNDRINHWLSIERKSRERDSSTTENYNRVAFKNFPLQRSFKLLLYHFPLSYQIQFHVLAAVKAWSETR